MAIVGAAAEQDDRIAGAAFVVGDRSTGRLEQHTVTLAND
jgi:hypothetical protein